MRTRMLVALALLLAPLSARAAVTSNQLVTLTAADAGLPFRQRVQFGLVLIAEQVAGESAGTAKHAQRAALASQILNNPIGYVTNFSQAVVVQLPLASTNMVTVAGVSNADVDTTDSAIQGDISAVFNFFLAQP